MFLTRQLYILVGEMGRKKSCEPEPAPQIHSGLIAVGYRRRDPSYVAQVFDAEKDTATDRIPDEL